VSDDQIIDQIKKARESYKLPPPKFLVTQREYDYLVSITPDGIDVEAFMDANYIVVMPLEAADTHINKGLWAGYLDRLGSLAIEKGTNLDTLRSEGVYRVAQDPDVSGIRGLGNRPSAVYFDEPYYPTNADCEWADGVTAQKWVEHRLFCKRDVLACLSGDSD